MREVHEQTGVWARVLGELREVSDSAWGSVTTARIYATQAVGRGCRTDRDRRHHWLPLPQALSLASHIETRELLQLAVQSARLRHRP